MQLKKTSKKIGSLINEVTTFSNEYLSFNNIDTWEPSLKQRFDKHITELNKLLVLRNLS